MGTLSNLTNTSVKSKDLNTSKAKTRNKQAPISGFKRRYIESQNLKRRPISSIVKNHPIRPTIIRGDTTKPTENMFDIKSLDYNTFKRTTPGIRSRVLTPSSSCKSSSSSFSLHRSRKDRLNRPNSAINVVFSNKKECSRKTHKILSGLRGIISISQSKTSYKDRELFKN